MKCPLKFGLYEFEGGEECVGAECGFFGSVCCVDAQQDSDAQSITELNMTEQSESLSDKADSREKLEADVVTYLMDKVTTWSAERYALNNEVIKWLDRQAAITEREWQESNDRLIDTMRTTSEQYREKIAELQARVDELTAQLRESNSERERLRGCLGIAADHAHDFLALVDESGNVYDLDEGLA